MPVKRRRAKPRDWRVTPEAVEAFRRDDYIGLGRLIGQKLWEPSPIEATTAEPPGDASWATREGWPRAREIRLALLDAMKALRIERELDQMPTEPKHAHKQG